MLYYLIPLLMVALLLGAGGAGIFWGSGGAWRTGGRSGAGDAPVARGVRGAARPAGGREQRAHGPSRVSAARPLGESASVRIIGSSERGPDAPSWSDVAASDGSSFDESLGGLRNRKESPAESYVEYLEAYHDEEDSGG